MLYKCIEHCRGLMVYKNEAGSVGRHEDNAIQNGASA